MGLKVENESAITADAVAVLMEYLPAAKVARVLNSWQIGQGDYLKMRDDLFAGETVQSLLRTQSGKPNKASGSGEP